MRKKHWNNSEQEDKGDIDLTPKLDVVFIMLIFFIVTASFLKEQSLPIKQPESSPRNDKDENPSMVLTLSSNDEISLENRRLDIRVVRAVVAQHIAESPGVPW